jgi:hypothetical protein
MAIAIAIAIAMDEGRLEWREKVDERVMVVRVRHAASCYNDIIKAKF